MSTDLRVLTSSELKTFRRCPREHRLSYVELVRPAYRDAAMRFGTLVHQALEAWWNASDARLAAALDVLSTALDVDPYELAKAEAMLAAYDARWRDEPLEVIAVEAEFETAIVNPATGKPSKTYKLRGKVDALVHHIPSGRVLIVEHKTSSEDFGAGSEYVKRLRLDSQISTYYAALRDLGHDVAGILYDVLGKPKHEPKLATPEDDRRYVIDKRTKERRLDARQRERDETVDEYQSRVLDAIAADPDRFLSRVEVVRLDSEELEARGDLWDTARILRESQLAGRAPRNPDACASWGRTCAYFALCTGETTADDTTRYRRAPAAHEELSAPTERAG
jgi:hypothetical protein